MNDDNSAIVRVTTHDAPSPAGHYSQALRHGGLVYVSGQLPVRPDGSPMVAASFEAQATQAVSNLLAILAAAGTDASRLLKVTVYIVGIANWPRFNSIYAQALGAAQPARSIVPVPELHHGYLVEIDAVAMA